MCLKVPLKIKGAISKLFLSVKLQFIHLGMILLIIELINSRSIKRGNFIAIENREPHR